MKDNKQIIDILIEEKLTDQLINRFLLNVFNTSEDRIIIATDDDLIAMSEINFSEIDCLCVKNYISGDANLLLNLYRYELSDNALIDSIQIACDKFHLTCYVPVMDAMNDWYKIKGISDMKIVKQIESEDDYFWFTK